MSVEALVGHAAHQGDGAALRLGRDRPQRCLVRRGDRAPGARVHDIERQVHRLAQRGQLGRDLVQLEREHEVRHRERAVDRLVLQRQVLLARIDGGRRAAERDHLLALPAPGRAHFRPGPVAHRLEMLAAAHDDKLEGRLREHQLDAVFSQQLGQRGLHAVERLAHQVAVVGKPADGLEIAERRQRPGAEACCRQADRHHAAAHGAERLDRRGQRARIARLELHAPLCALVDLRRPELEGVGERIALGVEDRDVEARGTCRRGSEPASECSRQRGKNRSIRHLIPPYATAALRCAPPSTHASTAAAASFGFSTATLLPAAATSLSSALRRPRA